MGLLLGEASVLSPALSEKSPSRFYPASVSSGKGAYSTSAPAHEQGVIPKSECPLCDLSVC